MNTMLTFKEKKYVEKLLSSSNNMETSMWPEWGAWALYALGGFLIVSVGFIFLENPHAITIRYVLLPGVAIGMALILFGSYTQHRSVKAEEQQVLADLLRKLMA